MNHEVFIKMHSCQIKASDANKAFVVRFQTAAHSRAARARIVEPRGVGMSEPKWQDLVEYYKKLNCPKRKVRSFYSRLQIVCRILFRR